MSNYIMNRESLKRHCEAMCKKFKDVPTSGAYSEHRLVLDLLKQTEWIPVSDGLPKKDGDYLLWGKIYAGEKEEYLFIGEYNSEYEQFGYLQEQFDVNTFSCLGSDFFEYASVIAWMPLPEQYVTDINVGNRK